MAIVVEDGTGVANANSYVSVANATAYLNSFYFSTDIATQIWGNALEADQEVALMRASRDIDAIYGPNYLSTVLTTTQGLLFPRQPFYQYNTQPYYAPSFDGYWYVVSNINVLITGVPQGLANAVAEMAVILLGGYDATGPADRSGDVKIEKLQIGSMRTEEEYFFASSTTAQNVRKVSTLMQPYLSISPFGVNVGLKRG